MTQLLHLDASTIWRVGWVVTIARCALPFGFLLSIVASAFFAASALKSIVGRLVDNPNASQLRTILADALDEPSIELGFRVDESGRFVDSSGEPSRPRRARVVRRPRSAATGTRQRSSCTTLR